MGGTPRGMLHGYQNKGFANWVCCKCLKIKGGEAEGCVYKKVTGMDGLILKGLEGLPGASKIVVDGLAYVPGERGTVPKEHTHYIILH